MDGPRQPTEDQAVHAYYILYILLSALQYAVLLVYYTTEKQKRQGRLLRRPQPHLHYCQNRDLGSMACLKVIGLFRLMATGLLLYSFFSLDRSRKRQNLVDPADVMLAGLMGPFTTSSQLLRKF